MRARRLTLLMGVILLGIVSKSFISAASLKTLNIRYGDILRLKDSREDIRLHSQPQKYYHAESSGRQQVTGNTGRDDNDWFIIQSAVGRPSGVVRSGDRVMLQHLRTNTYMYWHYPLSDPTNKAYVSPDKRGAEVACYGKEVVDVGNHWIVRVYDNGSPASDGSVWIASRRVVFEIADPEANKLNLWLSGSSFDVLNRPSKPVMQRVVALNTTPTYWVVEDVKVLAATVWGIKAPPEGEKLQEILYREGVTQTKPRGTSWTKIEGSLKNISIGPDGRLWGVDANDQIFFRDGARRVNPKGTSWTNIPGGLKKISVGMGGQVWGVSANDQIWFREGVTGANPKGTSWTNILGSLKSVSIGIGGQVWGVSTSDEIFFREGVTKANPKGTSWAKIDGGLMDIAVGPEGQVWGVDAANEIWFRDGVTRTNPKGTTWTKIGGKLKSISVGPDGQVCGIGMDDRIFIRDVSLINPKGTRWSRLTPELFASVAVGVALPPTRPPTAEVPINLAEGWEAEEGKLKAVAVGSRKEELEAWGVGTNSQLYKYDQYSMAPNPWKRHELKDEAGVRIGGLHDLSISSDGRMVAIRGGWKAVEYDWEKMYWKPIPTTAETEKNWYVQISVGNDKTLVATVGNGRVFKHDGKDWVEISPAGTGKMVVASLEGRIFGLNPQGRIFEFKAEGASHRWHEMTGIDKAIWIAVGDENNLLAIDANFSLYTYDQNGKKWVQMLGKDGKPFSGLTEIAINAAGTMFGIDGDGDPYHKGESGVKVTPDKKAKKVKPKKETRSKARKAGKLKRKKIKRKTKGQKAKRVPKELLKKRVRKTKAPKKRRTRKKVSIREKKRERARRKAKERKTKR